MIKQGPSSTIFQRLTQPSTISSPRHGTRNDARDVRQGPSRLDAWLQVVAERQASELLLGGRAARCASTPRDSIVGARRSTARVEEIVVPDRRPMPARVSRSGIADASHKVPGVGALSINCIASGPRRGGDPYAARRVPLLARSTCRPGTELLSRLQRGLVLVGGATGRARDHRGRVVEEINRRDEKHIITIESDRIRAVNHRR